MMWLIFIIVGMITGAVARWAVKGRKFTSFGIYGELIIGVAGALIGGMAMALFGIDFNNLPVGVLLAGIFSVVALGTVNILRASSGMKGPNEKTTSV